MAEDQQGIDAILDGLRLAADGQIDATRTRPTASRFGRPMPPGAAAPRRFWRSARIRHGIWTMRSPVRRARRSSRRSIYGVSGR